MVVHCVVRSGSVDVGGGAGKGICRAVVCGGMAVRDGILFRHMLVADICPDQLRRIPAMAGVFGNGFHRGSGRAVSGFVRGHSGGAAQAVRLVGIPGGSVRLGVYGVFAVLADGE